MKIYFLKSTIILFAIIVPYKEVVSQDFVESIFSEDKYYLALYELARQNNPDYLSLQHTKNISELEVKLAEKEWTNSIRAVGNINEFSINPSRNENNIFYPRYNFSVILPLGLFFQAPKNTKIAKEKLEITKNFNTKQEQQLKLEILKKYNNFLRVEELLKKQTRLTDSELSNYLILEGQFRNNDAELKDLNDAERNYTRELFKQINFQEELNTAKLELETVIGAPLPPRQ